MLKPRLKATFDDYLKLYATPDYIASDPLSIPDQFRHDPATCEWLALLTALLSYGSRPLIIKSARNLLSRMQGDPAGFMQQYRYTRDAKLFDGFVYRFNRGEDVAYLLHQIQRVLKDYGSLEALFLQTPRHAPLNERLQHFVHTLAGNESHERYGRKYLFPSPAGGGACKRMAMFLRWVVRNDGIDLGLWKQALTPAELIIPLDTHVSRLSREFGLTQRKSNDWQTAEDITHVFKSWHPADPIRYDFAMMGLGTAPQSKSHVKQKLATGKQTAEPAE